MIGPFEITRHSDDTHREVWRFNFIEPRIALTGYRQEERASKRHGWKSSGVHYDAYYKRNSTVALKDIPLPNDVAAEAKEFVMNQIYVARSIRDE